MGTAFVFNRDEGYELIKGLLVSRGYDLYTEIWNDQPPLHTGILALVFKLFGADILPGRLLAVAFSSLLLGSLYRVVARRSGHYTAWIVLLFLVASSEVVRLSVSVMLEPAMMAIGLTSIVALFNYVPRSETDVTASTRIFHSGLVAGVRSDWPFCIRHRYWLMLSGFIMGLALQTKLTAVIFIPAVVAELARIEAGFTSGLFPHGATGKRMWAVCIFRMGMSILLWGSMVAVGFALVWWLFPGETARHLLGSHFSAGTRTAFVDGPAFELSSLKRDWELVTIALIGTLFILVRLRKESLFVLVWLATVFAVHAINRPYWHYYWLHFAVPMAWLSGVAIREIFVLVISCDWFRCRWLSWKPILGLGLWLLVPVLLLSLSGKLTREWQHVMSTKTVAQDETVTRLKEWRRHVKWMYTDEPVLAFHARIAVPPEIAVLPKKRFASGQADEASVLDTVKKYNPEIIVSLPGSNPEWADYVESKYRSIEEYATRPPLFLRNDLVGTDQKK